MEDRKYPRVVINFIEVFTNPVRVEPAMISQAEKNLTWTQEIIASFFGSSVTALAVTPLDVVKIRLQAQQKHQEDFMADLGKPKGGRPRSLYLYRNGLMDFLCECNHCKENPVYKATSSRYEYPGSQHGRLNPAKDIISRTSSIVPPNFNGMFDAFAKIVKFEGVRSLWSGLSPTLFISIPQTIIYFPLYNKLKYALGYDEMDSSTWLIPPFAGSLCRIFMVVAFNPLELFRTKLQSEKLTYYQLYEAARFSFSHRGPSFLFSGVVTSLLRDVPFSAVYWLSYESIKAQILKMRQASSPAFLDSMAAGAVSGSAAALVTLPFDVIKTHRQIELGRLIYQGNQIESRPPDSTWKLIRDLYARKGIRGLYAGTVPRLIKVAPSCAIMISIYEGLKTSFAKYNCQLQLQEMELEHEHDKFE